MPLAALSQWKPSHPHPKPQTSRQLQPTPNPHGSLAPLHTSSSAWPPVTPHLQVQPAPPQPKDSAAVPPAQAVPPPPSVDGQTSALAVETEVVERLSREQVREIAHAVGTLSAQSALEEERNDMSALEAERLSAATSIEAAKLQTYQVR
eukprot:scaffold14283_cov73-Isochrysis_galbana.AAC.1